MKIKGGVSNWNVFSIGWPWFMECAMGGFVNAQMNYLLQDEDYYDVDEERYGRTSSNILTIAYVGAMFWSFFGGYIYDRFNRRVPIFVASMLGCGFVALVPHTAPSITWLTIVRLLLMLC